MTDESQPTDDDIAELLQRAIVDRSLAPRRRAAVRSAVLDEFDAAVSGATTGERTDQPDRPTPLGRDSDEPVTIHRSPRTWWPAVAAACVLVVGLVVVANTRDEPATSDEPGSVTTVPGETLPPAIETLVDPDLPLPLTDAVYGTELLAGGFEFRGQPGVDLVELRPDLLVLDLGAGGAQRRLSVFATDPDDLAATLDEAVGLGHVSISRAQFQVGDRSLPRSDINVTADGVADRACEAQEPCIALVDDSFEEPVALWARSENFLIELTIGDTPMFALLQTQQFGDPALGDAFDIISSFRVTSN